MKKLFLIRHGKSSWKHPDINDFERPLNERGENDAPFMGSMLNEKNVTCDLIISSPANRAYSTAKVIAGKINYPIEKIIQREEIYEASASEILDIIQEIDNSNNVVMLFGHNPGFTSLSNFISDKYIDNIPTLGICTIEFEISSWKDIQLNSGKLVSFDYPKKFSKNS